MKTFLYTEHHSRLRYYVLKFTKNRNLKIFLCKNNNIVCLPLIKIYLNFTEKYRLIIDLELKTITGKDGKTYRTVKNFKMEADPLEPVNYDFRNLFNGQKDLGKISIKSYKFNKY